MTGFTMQWSRGERGGRCKQLLADLATLCTICVCGLMDGNFGEVSDQLLGALATSRVQVAVVQRGRRGLLRSEDAEWTVAISSLRVRIGVTSVKAQSVSMLGRLEHSYSKSHLTKSAVLIGC